MLFCKLKPANHYTPHKLCLSGYTVFTSVLTVCPSVTLVFPNILKIIFISFCSHIDISKMYLHKSSKGKGPILLELLTFVKKFS